MVPLAKAAETVTTLPEGMRAENLDFFASTRQFFDTTKAAAALDVDHRSLEEGLPPVIEWEKEQLGIAE